MKRSAALFLVICMLFSLSACGSSEEPQQEPVTPPVELVDSGSCTDTISWQLDVNGLLTLSGTGAIPDYEKDANNQPWNQYIKTATSLLIGEGITRIGNRAFQNCSKITQATLAKSVTTVGEWAFQNCFALVLMDVDPKVQFENGALRSTPVEWDIGAVDSDLYKSSPYYAALQKVVLTGDYRVDVINVALSQLGYHEGNSPEDYAGNNQSGSKDYTEYGRYLNSIGRAWCSEFASWCIRKAGVPLKLVSNSRSATVYNFTKNSSATYYTWKDTIYGGGTYEPQPADLLLWDWDYQEYTTEQNASHTSLLRSVEIKEDGTVLFHSIDGNSGGKVREREYIMDPATGNLLNREGRLYWIVSPDYEGKGQ